MSFVRDLTEGSLSDQWSAVFDLREKLHDPFISSTESSQVNLLFLIFAKY